MIGSGGGHLFVYAIGPSLHRTGVLGYYSNIPSITSCPPSMKSFSIFFGLTNWPGARKWSPLIDMSFYYQDSMTFHEDGMAISFQDLSKGQPTVCIRSKPNVVIGLSRVSVMNARFEPSHNKIWISVGYTTIFSRQHFFPEGYFIKKLILAITFAGW